MFMNRYPFEEKAPNSKLQAPEKFQISNSEWICRAIIALCLLASAPLTYAFCGFYVAKADTSLFNKASQVVLVRHEDKTVLTMANDYQGSPKEFAILILSAEQSEGLETWLTQNGYRVPKGAASVLGSYIKQNMRFFVAKVNLQEKARLGYTYLRPIQVAYESPKFMLPIRLGMVNAEGPQEMFVFTLTRGGRVESTNYRTVRVPTDVDIPEFVRPGFTTFYRTVFDKRYDRE